MRLTYHRSSEFRAGLWMIAALMVLDAPLVLGILYLLPRHWGWIVGLMIGLLEVYVLATRIFAARFTTHRLTATGLDLRFGHWACTLPREQIAGVRPSDVRLDLELMGQLLTYNAAEDALVVSTYARCHPRRCWSAPGACAGPGGPTRVLQLRLCRDRRFLLARPTARQQVLASKQ